MLGHAGAKPMKMLFKTTSSLYISLLFCLGGTAAWWFCHLLTLEIIFAGTILDSPYWLCVLSPSRVIPTSSIKRTWKSPTNDIVFHFRPGCLFKSSISAKAYLKKFLQISSLATCKPVIFLQNWRAVRVTSLEEWKFTHCCLLNGDSDKMTYGNIYRLK